MVRRLTRRAVLGIGIVAIACAVWSGGLLARRQALEITTNKTNLLVGETLITSGVGFQPNEVVTLRVTHADGSIEASGAHGAFAASTDADGAFSASWSLSEDPSGNAFLLTVSGSVTGTVPPVAFNRFATVQTDKYDYAPGETTIITGAGFRANEVVDVVVEHTNGKNDGNGHKPFPVRAGADGSLSTTWLVDPDDSEGSIFRLTATGAESGLVATSTFTDLLITTIDDAGPDDEPGQKDLNQMAFEATSATALAISWNWDDTDFGNTGGNTGDACALVDTDKNGFADYAFCVVADGNPAVQVSNRLYSCGDSRSDRCAQPTALIGSFTSVSTASVVPNSDPFRLAPFSALHNGGNDCDADANCLTADTVANVTLQLSDVGGATNANLINVCSYPSQEPNSDPSDCVAKPNSGVLTIIKTVHDVPTLFGDATTDTFTFNASAPSTSAVSSWSKTFTAVGTQTVVSQVRYDATTTLDLTEVVPGSGWKLELLAGARCSIQTATSTATGTDTDTGVTDLEIKSGLETICTFSNTEDLELTHARLTLVKNVQSDNGGTAAATDWTLSAAGPTNKSGAGGFTNEMVSAGSYALSETGTVAGYTNGTTFSCVKNGNAPVENNTIQLVGGDIATCTITNDDRAPSLTLDKVLVKDNGGTATESDWTLTADGGAAGTLTGPGAAGNTDVPSGAAFKAGTYALSESTGPAGYTASAWSCVKNGGGAVEGASIALALGDTATCTITNNDSAPSLTLNKIVVNDNGGTEAESAWTLTANGGAAGTLTGPGAAGNTDVPSGATFKAGTYALSESTGPTGYTASAWSCVKNGGGAVEGASIALVLGDTATCTITNNDNAPSLTLDKILVKDNGGTATESDWTLTANGGAAGTLTGPGAAGNTDVPSGAAFKAGTYALSESAGPTGYTPSAWSCVKNGGAPVEGSSITLALGESATCTITNNDNAPSLTLDKILVKDNGGTATESDWTLTADGGAAGTLTGPGAAGNTDVPSGATFKVGTYALSESTGPTGYTASAWSCVTNGGSPVEGSSITLALGDSATCTITNNDNAPSLTLDKILVKDNGGTATESDWTLTADGGAAGTLTGPGAAGSTDVPSGAAFKAGTYALSESTGPTGYTASAWSCVKNAGSPVEGSSITLALGDSATCTITNNDRAPSLTLDKVLVKDNGGTATESDWTLTADGGAAGTLTGPGAAGNTDVPSGATFKTGTYALSESTGPTGYTASAWSCVKNGGSPVEGSSITIALGDSAICTITNNDRAPSLTLNKVLVKDNGGTATESNWTLTADGGAAGTLTGPGAAGNTDVPSGAAFKAGTYSLSESTGPAGYTASAWSCVKNGGGAVEGASIALALGDTATCTITNNDIAPSLTLNKIVVNDNGGAVAESAWTLTANGGTAGTLFGPGAAGNADVVSNGTFKAGTYELSESIGPYGYSASGWSCVKNSAAPATVTSIALGVGDVATCTITNNDQPGRVVVIKNAKPTNGNFAFTATGGGYNSFGLTGSTAGGGNQNAQTLNAGVYTVSESTQLGWLLTGIGGSTDPTTPYACVVTGSGGSTGLGDLTTRTATITLRIGDTVTCSFENTGNGATRTQGFWSTHTPLANIAWFGGEAFNHTFPGVAAVGGIGDRLICGNPIDTLGKVMGGFLSDIAKTSTGAKRSALGQARMQLLQQLLAAELNASAFGSVPSGGSARFAAWEGALCGTNQNAIKNAMQEAAAFNSAGDNATFTPGTSADSKHARAIADIAFWNIFN